MKTFTYKEQKTPNENWKLWVRFRFGNSPEDILDWEDEILFEINGNKREMTVSEVNEIMKEYCFPD